MLAWLRGSARTISAVVLVALTSLLGSSITPHEDDCHEGLCSASVFFHDASTHSVQATRDSADHPLHCVMCHSGRSFRPSSESAHNLAPSLTHTLRDQLQVASVRSSSPSSRPPLRSPPLVDTLNA